jgi:hypothetical protein
VAPTTTTTTIQQVWYQLTNCSGGGTVYSTNYNIGYAAVNDRVFGTVLGVPSTLVVASVLFSNPGGTQIGITNSGLTGCPATTTTTTTAAPVFSYYVATRCDNPSLQQNFRTTGSYVAGISVSYNGYCWEIQSLQGSSGVDAINTYINCASCYASNPTTTTTTTAAPTTTTTTASSPVNVVVESLFFGDVSISDVTVNSTSVTYVSGNNFPIDSNEQGTFQTSQTGTQTVVVYYNATATGQSITLVDSNGTSQCQDTSVGTYNIIFNSVAVNSSGNLTITATLGTCF